MAKEFFERVNFTAASLERIDDINVILDEYRRAGYSLSLRQLYYQLVARGIIENSDKSYKNTGRLVSDARLAGLVDWGIIEDRNRETITVPHWDSPADIVLAAAQSFRLDKWENQPVHVEVMVEKDALSGVLIPVCRRLDVRFTANKGYSSSSMMYEIGKRLAKMVEFGKDVVILYMGDHDPSGIDMTRDIADRLELFSRESVGVERLALNIDQVRQLNPPENPAKLTDSRAKAYVTQFGDKSWELDAVEPRELARLVESFVVSVRDPDIWDEAVARENRMRAELKDFADNYEDKDDEERA